MTLLQRMERAREGGEGNAATPGLPPLAHTPGQGREALLRDLRLRFQDEAVSVLHASAQGASKEEIRSGIEALVARQVTLEGFALTRDERAKLVDDMYHEITGLGPLEPLLADESITEIMVNGPYQVYIERHGKIERVPSGFTSDEHVLRIIDRIITPLGRRIDDMSPRVDARLEDGSRVNAIIEPLSLIGPVITIRKFSARPYTVADLVQFGTATADMFEFLRVCIESRLNVFVSGGTGSGKTTTLNVLSSFIPEEERIITIEDAAELQLHQEHIIRLEARPANLEGEGEITIRDLVRNALHMRPDRIIVGECRSGEALDMLQAMTTGHDGSLSTGHANSPADMLRRLETMVLMTGYELPLHAIREQLAAAVDLIVHTARLRDGTRKITKITEICGIEDEKIITQDIFEFKQTGLEDGKIQGRLAPTGIRPTFMAKLRTSGVTLPPDEFGVPPEDPEHPDQTRVLKGRWTFGEGLQRGSGTSRTAIGRGRVVTAGGMVYVTSVGPIDLQTNELVSQAVEEQTRQCMANLKAKLEEAGSSLEKIVWANWSLRDPTEFDAFNEEWAKWFPADAPIGQGTIMPNLQRRAGFRVSIGVIAQL